jgi:hypothetical protein
MRKAALKTARHSVDVLPTAQDGPDDLEPEVQEAVITNERACEGPESIKAITEGMHDERHEEERRYGCHDKIA